LKAWSPSAAQRTDGAETADPEDIRKNMTTLIIEKNVMIPMRDGVRLAANIYRLEGAGPAPVLLARSPYDKEGMGNGDGTLDFMRAVQAGYVIVTQDTRGRFASEGTCSAFRQEREDGADTIAWAAAQPWSNGAVGMFAGSYLGNAQWMAAVENPPALRVIAPLVGFADLYGAFSLGGLPLLLSVTWTLAMAQEELRRQIADGRLPPEGPGVAMPADNPPEKHLPLDDIPFLRGLAPYYYEWLDNPTPNAVWEAIWPRDGYRRVRVPALNIGGWYDCFLKHTLDNYVQMKRGGGSPEARQNQRLVIGPWSHGGFAGSFPERDFGPSASIQACDLHGLHMRWFDRWLKGSENGIENEKPVKIFVMGIDQWREETDWPLPDAKDQAYYLHSAGAANTLNGDGALSIRLADDDLPDIFLYNPLRPAPTLGGQVLIIGANATGPRDQRPVEGRDDVLVYTTPPLDEPLEVTGPVSLQLFVSSSARDTDFTGKLVDVFPDGRAILLTEGALRARYRHSPSEPELLEPGQVYELNLDLWATANVFLPGHSIRLEVSSSSFPRLARNTNTGGEIAHEGVADCIPAVNRVYHDRAHPSRLILPVVTRS
jgi:uncharacterized protein